jgi:hypothetical protein
MNDPAGARPGLIGLLPGALDSAPEGARVLNATPEKLQPPVRTAAALDLQAADEPATKAAAVPSAAAGSGVPASAVKPRFRAFVSDADRRTLDGLHGASGRR